MRGADRVRGNPEMTQADGHRLEHLPAAARAQQEYLGPPGQVGGHGVHPRTVDSLHARAHVSQHRRSKFVESHARMLAGRSPVSNTFRTGSAPPGVFR